MKLSFNCPINSVSFGQVSTAILREAYKKGYDSLILPIGDAVDLGCQKHDEAFTKYLRSGVDKFLEEHDLKTPTFRLWHLNGSLHSYSDNEVLLSFYELDSPTKAELNVVKNVRTAFSSKHTVEVFKEYGAECEHIPLGFDSHNFYKKDKEYHTDDRITFNIGGKLEKRKHHMKMIKAWIKKYGNDKRYALQCAIYNPFFSPQDNNTAVGQICENKKYFNVNFLPTMEKNSQYNDFLNSADIFLGGSGGEGWGLPEFQSACLGKHLVILNCRGYKDWVDEEIAVQIEPNGKLEAYDNIFFKKGDKYNQGYIEDFKEDDFIFACEEAVRRVEKNKTNEAGEKLKQRFTYEQTLNAITNILSK